MVASAEWQITASVVACNCGAGMAGSGRSTDEAPQSGMRRRQDRLHASSTVERETRAGDRALRHCQAGKTSSDSPVRDRGGAEPEVQGKSTQMARVAKPGNLGSGSEARTKCQLRTLPTDITRAAGGRGPPAAPRALFRTRFSGRAGRPAGRCRRDRCSPLMSRRRTRCSRCSSSDC